MTTWTEQRGPDQYIGRRVRVDERTRPCPDPAGHEDQWLSSELSWWERSKGIHRNGPACPQCGRRLPS